MMNILNKGRKTDLVRNTEELSVAQARIAEVKQQLANLQTIKNAIALEIELTGTD